MQGAMQMSDEKLRLLLEDLTQLEYKHREGLPFFSLWVEDFLFGTRNFTAEERGIYMALICGQWKQGSLPNDMAELADIAGVTLKRFEKLWPRRIARKFQLVNDRWYNVRAVRTKIDALKRVKRRPN
jgi:uncharacterized protein YdaU (DUF1376 family)